MAEKSSEKFNGKLDLPSITHQTSIYEHKDRFSFIRRHFLSPEEDASDFNRRLLELDRNEHNLRTLNLPLEEKHFGLEVNEELFEQLYSAQKNKNGKRHANLSYRQLLVANHLREDLFFKLKSDFIFSLDFLQKIVSSTNDETFGLLILSLLNVLSIWFDLGVLDLHPIFTLSHDYLLVRLYLHLPIFLVRKITQVLLITSEWLRKFESPLYERLGSKNSDEAED